MIDSVIASVGAKLLYWIEEAYFHDCVDETAEGVLEATRWGWLPALSGVAIAMGRAADAREQFRAEHGGTPTRIP